MFDTTRTTIAMLALATAAAGVTVALPHAEAASTAHSTTHSAAGRLRHVSPHIMGRHRRHAGGRQQSLNWSGYIRGGTGYTSVRATWTIPTVKSTQDGFSSTWVGIDGATGHDQYLIQTGTEADVSGGRRSYRAWWEVITPTDEAPETLFPDLTVSPGDSVTASVARAASGSWRMTLRDNTTKRSASHTTAFAGPGSSAEWIQEDTDVNGYISTAPNWGSVTFTKLSLNGANPKLQPKEAVDIVDSHGTREATTGAPSGAGNGFTVTWLAPGTKTSAG